MSGEWISVEDRLPDFVGDLLVYKTYPGCYGSISLYSFQIINDVGRFCFWDNEWDKFIPTDNVTHWMPLPKPPTETKLI